MPDSRDQRNANHDLAEVSPCLYRMRLRVTQAATFGMTRDAKPLIPTFAWLTQHHVPAVQMNSQPIQFERYRDTIYLAEKVYHGERDYRVYFDSLEDVLPRNPEDYPDELYFFHAIGNKFDLREGDPHGTHQRQYELHARLDDLINYRDTYAADE